MNEFDNEVQPEVEPTDEEALEYIDTFLTDLENNGPEHAGPILAVLVGNLNAKYGAVTAADLLGESYRFYEEIQVQEAFIALLSGL